MISIIISSADKRLLDNVTENVRNTIGVPYEILAYDNSQGRSGICEIYNKGAKEARFGILCYMHEDLDIKTLGWGEMVINLFDADTNLGVIGVAGSSYKTLAPSAWRPPDPNDLISRYNYIQSYKYQNAPSVYFNGNPDNERLSEVVCVDGLWFCTRKNIAIELPFDEELLKGFHCYDVDFCLNVKRKYKIGVTFEILIEHLSEGSFDRNWLNETLKLHRKWRPVLPLNVSNLTTKQIRSLEKQAFKEIFRMLSNFKFPASNLFSILWKYSSFKTVGVSNFLKLHRYVLKYKMQSLSRNDL